MDGQAQTGTRISLVLRVLFKTSHSSKYRNILNSKVITKIFTKTHDCQVDLLSLQVNNNFSGSCFRIREVLNFGNLSFLVRPEGGGVSEQFGAFNKSNKCVPKKV